MEPIIAVAFLSLWLGTMIYAARKHPDDAALVIVLCLLGGLLGYSIALIILSTPKHEPPQIGDVGVQKCPHCGAPYRTSDYREDVAISCSTCRQVIRGALE